MLESEVEGKSGFLFDSGLIGAFSAARGVLTFSSRVAHTVDSGKVQIVTAPAITSRSSTTIAKLTILRITIV